MSRRIYLVLAVLCMALLVPLVATAQQQETPVFTFVALWNVPRAQWGDFTAFAEKNTRPILDRLLADGTLVGWGNFNTVVHTEDGYTHGAWFAASSIAAIERALGELLKLPPNPAALGARHRDHLFRTLIHRARTVNAANGYLWVSALQVKPGKGQEWRDLWEKYTKATYDELQANGTLASYEVEVEQVHTESPAWRFIVYVAPSADAVDKVRAAMAALGEKRSAEERRTISAAFEEVVVPGAHWDYFAHVQNYAHK